MEKVNSVAPQNAQITTEAKTEETNGKSYLLKEPIKDTVEISTTEPKKKKAPLALIVGGIVAGTVAIIALARHKKPKFDDISTSFSKTSNSSGKSSRSGGSGSSGGVGKSSYSGPKRTKEEQEAFDKGYNDYMAPYRKEEELRNKKIEAFKKNYANTTEKTSLEDLKKEISATIPNIVNFNKPSEMLEKCFKDCTKKYSEDFLINMFAFVKKQQPNIKEPAEALKNKQSGIYILSKLYTEIVGANGRNADPFLINKKYSWVETKISKEIDELLDSNIKNAIPDKVRKTLKEKGTLSSIFADKPCQSFSLTLNKTADLCLEEILKKHVIDKTITPDGKKLLDAAEKLNDEAIRLNIRMGSTEDSIKLDLGSTGKTIKNYKQGKYKSGRDEFWQYYFNRKTNKTKTDGHTGNNEKTYHSYTEKDIKQESLNIFAKYGEKLGDLNSLKEDALKNARRRLSLKYHPDYNKGNEAKTTEIMQEINAAFDELLKSLNNN